MTPKERALSWRIAIGIAILKISNLSGHRLVNVSSDLLPASRKLCWFAHVPQANQDFEVLSVYSTPSPAIRARLWLASFWGSSRRLWRAVTTARWKYGTWGVGLVSIFLVFSLLSRRGLIITFELFYRIINYTCICYRQLSSSLRYRKVFHEK